MTQRIAVFLLTAILYEEHGYSPAIRSGDLLFVSGRRQSHRRNAEPDFQKNK